MHISGVAVDIHIRSVSGKDILNELLMFIVVIRPDLALVFITEPCEFCNVLTEVIID